MTFIFKTMLIYRVRSESEKNQTCVFELAQSFSADILQIHNFHCILFIMNNMSILFFTQTLHFTHSVDLVYTTYSELTNNMKRIEFSFFVCFSYAIRRLDNSACCIPIRNEKCCLHSTTFFEKWDCLLRIFQKQIIHKLFFI